MSPERLERQCRASTYTAMTARDVPPVPVTPQTDHWETISSPAHNAVQTQNDTSPNWIENPEVSHKLTSIITILSKLALDTSDFETRLQRYEAKSRPDDNIYSPAPITFGDENFASNCRVSAPVMSHNSSNNTNVVQSIANLH